MQPHVLPFPKLLRALTFKGQSLQVLTFLEVGTALGAGVTVTLMGGRRITERGETAGSSGVCVP